MKKPEEIKPADGKLGVLLPGFGAVATTFVAGVETYAEGEATGELPGRLVRGAQPSPTR